MDLRQVSKRLRQIADSIDDLLGLDRPTAKETPSTATKILKKAHKYRKGTHWTQKPENKKKLALILKARHEAA